MHRGRTVLAMDCVLAGAETQRGRPLNSVVRVQMESVDISTLVASYRAAVQNLWNSAYLPMLEADLPLDHRNEWDVRNEFEDLCVDLFSGLVLSAAGAPEPRLAPAYRADGLPLPQVAVIPEEGTQILVAEPEGNSFRGYDQAITARRNRSLELRFRALFDYDVLNSREFAYCHAVITSYPSEPGLVGRNVLVKADQAKYAISAL